MADQDENQRLADEKKRLAKARRRARRNVQENTRRHNLRQGFERLSALIPGAEGQAAAERVVIRHAVDFIHAAGGAGGGRQGATGAPAAVVFLFAIVTLWRDESRRRLMN
ncbi:hypothetical protein B0T24DRAFT_598268 [Lasiosphaeria ovina]|uniref:BHLH domain-containing protein n=1 Tax=Lasiosphaeria ovina TaxID=92902 RepID=A0AAE0MZU4_9PEZI|nr:hypothetical protein B0T24DRAFT_598268 [Lasiosphaeria ovina]